MTIWHWPQYGIAALYTLIIFGQVILYFKAKSGEGEAKALGNATFYLLLIVTLHCGGFW